MRETKELDRSGTRRKYLGNLQNAYATYIDRFPRGRNITDIMICTYGMYSTEYSSEQRANIYIYIQYLLVFFFLLVLQGERAWGGRAGVLSSETWLRKICHEP